MDYLLTNEEYRKEWEGVPINRDGKVRLRDGRTGFGIAVIDIFCHLNFVAVLVKHCDIKRKRLKFFQQYFKGLRNTRCATGVPGNTLTALSQLDLCTT